jgi:hypothetical protein
MSASKSSPTNTTTTSTQAQETNLAATNTQGITLVGTGNKNTQNTTNNTITTNISTDQGAVQAGSELGQAAIAANSGLTQTVSADSFSFANHALDVISQDQTNSAALVQNYLSQGAADLNQTESAFTNLEQQNQTAANTQFGNIASTLASIAQSNDTSQATQAQAANQQITLYIIGGVVVIAAAWLLMRRSA